MNLSPHDSKDIKPIGNQSDKDEVIPACDDAENRASSVIDEPVSNSHVESTVEIEGNELNEHDDNT